MALAIMLGAGCLAGMGFAATAIAIALKLGTAKGTIADLEFDRAEAIRGRNSAIVVAADLETVLVGKHAEIADLENQLDEKDKLLAEHAAPGAIGTGIDGLLSPLKDDHDT